ncbi:MAG TPA: KH domain-containing protein [Dissulfuribacter thermophilus]|uniref:RNA-binding protein KhpB n=1 Tax=Dissulfuribacter thermophilus TaxID=1156395 RepID=A0A7V2WSN0_9BACT|nr:KH domain-containing protein [Dissulfuribacter thermophilus]
METQRIFEGKTVDHAIEEALKYFECTRDELEIDVITKGSTGIFGIGGRKAQIRVNYVPKTKEEERSKEEETPEREAEEVHVAQAAEEEGPSQVEMEEETREEGPLREHLEAEPFMEEAKEILSELLRLSNIDATVKIEMDSQNGPYLNVESEDLSLVIGKGGQNLGAFKYVMNLMLKRRHEGCPTIEVDAQGYLEKRRQQIEASARRLAEKAKKSGRSQSLEPMNARERRFVHLAVKRIKGVTTKSVGEGDSRRVVIYPQRRRGGGGGGRPRQRRLNRQSGGRDRRH